ncbi:MAG: PilT/PilU family type 4a pilus ATPase [Planctomycetota bacterium]|nr:MAG: PilT/PilU family type 4a pilus ATPase [Planctomycetota bacterium]
MPTRTFRCPHCAGTFQVESQPKEQQVNCSHCRGLVKIPAQAPVAAAAAAPGAKAKATVAAPNIRVAGAPARPNNAQQPSILEMEPDSPLQPERPTAVPTIPVLQTSLDELSIHEVLRHGRAHKVSDIHVAAGSPVMFRIARRLVQATPKALTSKQSERLSLELLNEHQEAQFRKDLDFDYMAIDDYGRYRVNVGYFDGDVGTVIRILAQRPKTLDELKLPPVVRDLTQASKGLVLLTGAASQGKTTTMTAMIDVINSTQPRHIITIEDPIEYLHSNKVGIVRQRQIGRDTKDFHSGLRAALRQNPDVISIGEMRDFETIKIALTAAETGCLVVSTLHIMSIDKIIERLLSFVPVEEEGHIRYTLADTLVGIIHQELLPARDGGKRVAAEILVVNQATKHIIRNRGTYFLRNVITTGKKHGMVAMQTSLQNLVDEGAISQETMNDVMVNYR